MRRSAGLARLGTGASPRAISAVSPPSTGWQERQFATTNLPVKPGNDSSLGKPLPSLSAATGGVALTCAHTRRICRNRFGRVGELGP